MGPIKSFVGPARVCAHASASKATHQLAQWTHLPTWGDLAGLVRHMVVQIVALWGGEPG